MNILSQSFKKKDISDENYQYVILKIKYTYKINCFGEYFKQRNN